DAGLRIVFRGDSTHIFGQAVVVGRNVRDAEGSGFGRHFEHATRAVALERTDAVLAPFSFVSRPFDARFRLLRPRRVARLGAHAFEKAVELRTVVPEFVQAAGVDHRVRDAEPRAGHRAPGWRGEI